jgi:UDPglucose--hexose-1-phosphate uridylyltransferase
VLNKDMDFKFVENSLSSKWTISAPRRAKRPDIAKGEEPPCPFCSGRELLDKEVYRVGGKADDQNWQIRVVNNKYPFAPIHEVIVHSPDHHKSFDELPLSQSELIFKTYRQRFETHQDKGQVYIFHNHGEAGGESLPHPHSQLAVVPDFVKLDVAPLDFAKDKEEFRETEHHLIFAPLSSEWPDEVWIAPKRAGLLYSETSDAEIKDLAKAMYRLIQIFDLRHGHEFPFNFYISPSKGWYLRIVPRLKNLGGFEIGTGISVNTQDPKETIAFIKEHFESPDEEKIRTVHRAQYKRAA